MPPDTNVEEFEFAIRTVCEPIFEKPLAEISLDMYLLNLFNTARRFNMEVQPRLGVTCRKPCSQSKVDGASFIRRLDLWKAANLSWSRGLKIRSVFRRW
ncbi:hypothetical protein ACNKHV_24400 [Shigella flexneri]